eukprot:m.126416 g.126416  ORF g.126416 m.126416 type:complete len:887 (+) comp12993_c1_seq1:61-2721(+)
MGGGEFEEEVQALFDRIEKSIERSDKKCIKLNQQHNQLEKDVKEGSFASIVNEDESPLGLELQEALAELQELRASEITLKQEIEGLMDEKYSLFDEVNEVRQGILSKQEEEKDKITKHVNNLQSYIKNIKDTMTTAKRTASRYQQTVDDLKDEVREFEEEHSLLHSQFLAVNNKPTRLAKQANVFQTSVNTINRQLDDTNSQFKELKDERKTALEEIETLHLRLSEMEDSIGQLQYKRSVAEKRTQTLKVEVEKYEDQSVDLLGDRAAAETQETQLQRNLRLLKEKVLRTTRDNDKIQQNLQTSEERFNKVNATVTMARKNKQQLVSEMEREKDLAIRIGQRTEKLEEELNSLERQWKSTDGLKKDVISQVHSKMLKNREKEKDAQLQQIELQEQHRKVRSMQKSVDAASIEKMKANRALAKTTAQKKSSVLNVRDYEKSYEGTVKTLKNVEALYNTVKNEKNTCMALINTAQQKQLEMKDSARILHTEIEILRSSAIDKDNQFTQQKTENAACVTANDALRNDVNILAKTEKALCGQMERVLVEKGKLDMVIKNLELKHETMRKERQRIIDDRDALVDQLNTISHTLATHYEMLHIQHAAHTDTEVACKELEDDIRFLRLEVAQMKQQNINLTKGQIRKDNVVNELVKNQMELQSVQKKVKRLEDKLSDPEWSKRFRRMDNKTDDINELQEKLESLALRMSEKESQLQELQHVLSETEKLCDRAQSRVHTRREDVTNVAQARSRHNKRLQDLGKKLMATVSELSMYQAQAMQYEQQLSLLKEEIAEAQRRMDEGFAPTDEAAEEWEKMQLQSVQRERAAHQQRTREEEELGQGQPRPTAYMPDAEGTLPIARPFGTHAPFKPTAPPAHLRHFKRNRQGVASSEKE